MTRARLPVALAAVLLSGCLAPAPVDDVVPEVPDLFGLVLDGAGQPLADAEVAVVDLRTRSGPDGAFAFADVPPGDLVVVARKAGHLSQSARVTLAPALSAHVVFTLVSYAEAGMEGRLFEFSGFLPCSLELAGRRDCGAPMGGSSQDRFHWETDLHEVTVEAFDVTLDWDAAGPSTETLRLSVVVGGTEQSVRGPPPLRLDLHGDDLAALQATGTLDLAVGLDGPGLALAQSFDGLAVLTVSRLPAV